MSENERQAIAKYYGKVLESDTDLRPTSYCTPEAPFQDLVLQQSLPKEINEKSYGCANLKPFCLENLTILDLGCGAGRDAFLLAKQVGPKGKVIGIDMTPEQLKLAKAHQPYISEIFKLPKGNPSFVHGYMEHLADIHIEDESIDLVVSNCAFNLSLEKELLFKEIHRVLKPGGELYFADIFHESELPSEALTDPLLLNECLAGAMSFNNFATQITKLGFSSPLITNTNSIHIEKAALKKKLGQAQFSSKIIRCFKTTSIPKDKTAKSLATYLGTIEEAPDCFELALGLKFRTNVTTPTSASIKCSLQQSRFAPHFNLN